MYLVETRRKKEIVDAEAQDLLHSIHDLKIDVKDVRISQVYILTGEISQSDAEAIAQKVLLDPIIETYKVTKYKRIEQTAYPSHDVGDWEAMKLFHHGVTDNIGDTALVMMHNLGFKKVESVMTGKKFIIKGGISFSDMERIGTRVLANPIIESFTIRKTK